MSEILVNRIGMKAIMNCGLEAECIAYRTYRDCDFKFNNGEIVSHKRWGSFKNQTLTPKSMYNWHWKEMNSKKVEENIDKYLGKKYETDYGYTYEVIEYNSIYDITVRFNDGYIMKTNWQQLGKSLRRPDLIVERYKDGTFKRLIKKGDVFSCQNNLTVEVKDIIDEGRRQYVVIQYPNGDNRKMEYRRLYDGCKLNYHGKVSLEELYKDKEFKTVCGLKCKFDSIGTKKNKYSLIRVIFEDGLKSGEVTLQALKKGTIKHPLLLNQNGFNMFYGYKVKRHLQLEDNVYYGVYNECDDLVCLATLRELIHSNVQTNTK